jgi:hypothetical protein
MNPPELDSSNVRRTTLVQHSLTYSLTHYSSLLLLYTPLSRITVHSFTLTHYSHFLLTLTLPWYTLHIDPLSASTFRFHRDLYLTVLLVQSSDRVRE